MKKTALLFAIIFLGAGWFFCIANAQGQSPALSGEAITSYLSSITVNIDNSVDVMETVTYDTGPQERHGIYRDIYPYSSQNRTMAIENVTVVDENGNPYNFQISSSGGNIRIKIGDPDRTFSGRKVYIIKYRATRAVAQLKDIDEIYWNVTGNGWPMPIYQTQATVTLPSQASMAQSACYHGPKGSTLQCQSASGSNGSYRFSAPSALGPYEGLTVAVGFTKGIVVPYSSSDAASNSPYTFWHWLIAALLPVLTLILSLWYWYKKGRDPRGTGMIIPQYDVPDGLTPMEVGGIANEKVRVGNISAEIIYLATKGYVKIRQMEESFIGPIKTTDYELTKLKDAADLPNDFDRKLMRALFGARPRITMSTIKDLFSRSTPPDAAPAAAEAKSVKLSDLRDVFYKDASLVVASVLNSILNKGYYKNLGRMKPGGNRIFLVIFISLWAAVFFWSGSIRGVFFLGGDLIPLMAGIFLSIIVYGIVSYFSPAKTEKGVAVKEYILGFKDYLQIVEKDRLQFHNAPEKRPETFEKFLPYAMILGVANIWAKEFEGIYTTPPTWYSGPASGVFSAITFNQTMSNFSSFASSSLGSSPGGGGSGGGGSSGGGGGGGGGGGW